MPNNTDRLKIHKVISRGEGLDAQVLLVVISAPAKLETDDEDIWVGIGMTEPKRILRIPRIGDSVEVARQITYPQLTELDLEHNFGLPDESKIGRGYRLARFDFSDHPDVNICWRKAVQAHTQYPSLARWRPVRLRYPSSRAPDRRKSALPGNYPRPAFDVTCWRAKPGLDAEKLDIFEPLNGLKDWSYVEMAVFNTVTQPLFELGVLFVHGIGTRGARETLVRWSEPIVNFWVKRALAISAASRDSVTPDNRARIKRWLNTHPLRSRAPLDGISEAVDNMSQEEWSRSSKGISLPKDLTDSVDETPLCMAVKAEQTLFPERNPDPGSPSATLFRLSQVDANASLRESHVLFAESAWAREAFPPTTDELRAWLTTSIPIFIWAQLVGLATTRGIEIKNDSKDAVSWLEKFRVNLSWLILKVEQVVLPSAYVMLALASQVAIALVGLLGLLPIPWLSRGIRWLINGLMGTIGQSYALQSSKIRRSAIVSSVALDIDWLSQKCQKMVIVSYSQGAEISRLAFLEARSDKLERWYTVGSGIAQLNMLRPKSMEKQRSQNVVCASNILLIATLLLVGGLVLDSIPGVSLGIHAVMMRLVHNIHPDIFAVCYVWFSYILILLCSASSPDVSPLLRRSLIEKWTDFYASEDPVPGGSLQDLNRAGFECADIKGYKQFRIFNTRFALLDHTTYLKNIEQFVAPVALVLLRYCGMGCTEKSEQDALVKAAKSRELRTWWTLAVSLFTMVLAAVTFAWIAFGAPRRADAWSVQGRSILVKGKGFGEQLSYAWNSGIVGKVLIDLRLPLLLVSIMIISWIVNERLGTRSVKELIKDLAKSTRATGP